MSKPFRFALCADDYAMAPGVSRGIREALEAGRLSATSAMTNFDAWPKEATALRPFADRADIGLHLNLTCGRPLGAMPTFASAGALPTIGDVIRPPRGETARHSAIAAEIAAEIERQLDAFVDSMGRPPDHVDGHQHVQVLPPVRRLLLAALDRRGWRPWLRDSADRPLRIIRRGVAPIKAAGVAWLARGFSRDASRAGFATNEGFAGFSTFDTTRPYASAFSSYLAAPGAAQLVMCHPGHADETLRRLDPVVDSRERELAFLLSPMFGEVLMAREATLTRLSDF